MHVLWNRLFNCLFLIAVLLPCCQFSCPGGENQPYTWYPDFLHREISWELRPSDGAVVPLTPKPLDLDPGPLAEGEAFSRACRRLHWGLTGDINLTCSSGSLIADTSGCRREGCVWHRFIKGASQPYDATYGESVDVYFSGANTKIWTSMVLSGTGVFYALPFFGPKILRIDAGTGAVSALEIDSSFTAYKAYYSTAVVGADNRIYGVPYTAPRVVSIDPSTDEVSVFPDMVGSQIYKWSHGVLAHDGQIYCVPAYSPHVMMIDPKSTSSAFILSTADLVNPVNVVKWIWGVLAPNGHIYCIPDTAPSVLRIDPFTQSASLHGDFGTTANKWSHGVVGVDGRIYGVPSSAEAILRIDGHGAQPIVEADVPGLSNLPSGQLKWSQGVVATNGFIYCVPRNHPKVLVIQPSTGFCRFLVEVPGGNSPSKYGGGILAPNGVIYAFPESESKVIQINPREDTPFWPLVTPIGDDLGGFDGKFTAAAVAPNGNILGLPGAALQVLWMRTADNMCTVMPPAQNATCTLGLQCVVTVTGFGAGSALSASNAVWVGQESYECFESTYVSLVGAVLPVINSTVAANGGRNFNLGTIVSGVASSSSRLCWAPEPSSLDIVETGTFTLLGPYLGSIRSCTLGLHCSISIDGLGLLGGSVVLIIPSSSACGDSSVTHPNIEGYSNPHALSTTCSGSFNSTSCDCSNAPCVCTSALLPLNCNEMVANGTSNTDTSITHAIGTSSNGVAGVYKLCWTQGSSVGLTAATFVVFLSEFRLVGPELRTPQGISFETLSCWSGYACGASVTGTDLSASNRLTIRNASTCSEMSPLAVISGLLTTVAPTDSSGQSYDFGVAAEGGIYGDYSVCWHSTAEAQGIFLRSLKVYGPIGGGLSTNCTLGYPCSVEITSSNIVGVPEAFSSSGMLVLVPHAASCPGSAATLWPGISNPTSPSNSAVFFDLGTPTSTTFAESQSYKQTYALCWSRNGNAEAFRMRIGTLLLVEALCTVPFASFDHTQLSAQDTNIEPCESLDTGLFIYALQHTEACRPRCSPNFDPSLDSLKCEYGILTPSSYECQERCLNKPFVTNGLDQAACVGLRHGEVCIVNCPADHIKSGDLLCDYGHFLHQPAIAPKLLFDVPRCYRSCQAQAVGCEGTANILHGGTCTPKCPVGSTSSISEVECWDGEARPSSFECYAGCAAAPDIPHSQDLSACASAPNLGRCILACESGYLKTGDPICRDGFWSTVHCLSPCQGPTPENAASPSCEEGASVTHASKCRVVCAEGYSAEVTGNFEPGVRPFLMCNDGALSPPSFICNKRCMRAPVVEYADENGLADCIGTEHGETCPAPCLSGYQKSNDLLCTDGEFSTVVCRKKCDEPPVVDHMLPSTCAHGAPGETCEVQCESGYRATGISVCQDGKWSEVQCLETCPAPTDVINALNPSCVEGVEITNGLQCTPSCSEGFTSSRTVLECIAGSLEPSTFRCSRLCGAVGTIPHAADLSHCTGREVGSPCEFQCVDGFKPVGQLRCEFGGWSQYRGKKFMGAVAQKVRRGALLGTVHTSAEFELSFDITLKERANMHYQSILHITATGNNCCEIGDRVPAVLLMPAAPGSGKVGNELHVFLDSGPGCELSRGLQLNRRTSVRVSFLNGILKVTLDGYQTCARDYGSFPTEALVADAKVYAGSPWDEEAVAYIAEVEYKHAGLEGTMPSCVPVVCDQPVPEVSGARTDMLVGQHCIGKPYGFVCSDIPCDNGTSLTSNFVCGGYGSWLPQNGVAVVCATSQCPKELPSVQGSDPSSFCDERRFGDLCAVKCLPGHTATGAFTCGGSGGDAKWIALPGNAPMCMAKPCGPVPVVPNGMDALRCSELPSSASCTIACSASHIPLGRYRCEAQLWTEAPICAPQEMLAIGDASYNIWVVKAGLAAEPSSDVQQSLPSVGDWADNVARAASSALSTYFTQTSGKPTSVSILAYVGSALTETGAASNNRLLQDSFVRPKTWRADVSVAIVPNGTTKNDAQELADGLLGLPTSQLEAILIGALPSHARPASALAIMSPPRLVELPPNVVDELHTLSPLKSVVTETITTTQTTLVSGNPTNTSNSSLVPSPSGGSPQYTAPQSSQQEEAKEGGMNVIHLLFILAMPIAGCMGCWSCWRYSQYNERRPRNVLASETGDWKNCIEAYRGDDHMEGIDEKKLTDFLTRQAAEQRAMSLKKGLTGRQDDTFSKVGTEHEKSIKEIAQDWKNLGVKQSHGLEEARREAKKYRCVRLAVLITRMWRKRQKKTKINLDALEEDFTKKQDQIEEAMRMEASLANLEDGLGESEHSQHSREGEEEGEEGEEEHQDDEDTIDPDAPIAKIKSAYTVHDIVATANADGSDFQMIAEAVDSEARDDIEATSTERKGCCRRFCGRIRTLCEHVASRLASSPSVGSTFCYIFDFLDLNVAVEKPSRELTASSSSAPGDSSPKGQSEGITPRSGRRRSVVMEAVEEYVDLGPQIPPALLWEFRQFGDNVIINNHLVKDDGTKIPGHWIDDHKFTCSVEGGTWIASFRDHSVQIFWSEGRLDNHDVLECEDHMEPVEDLTYHTKEFFDFPGKEQLDPPWANAPPFFDFKISQKGSKTAAAAEMFSSTSDTAGNVIKVKKDLVIDYQKVQCIETVTTRFNTPNRNILKEHKSARLEAEESEDDYDEETESDEAEPDPEGSIENEHHPQYHDPDSVQRANLEGGEEETLVTMSVMESADEDGGRASYSSDFTHGRKTRGDHDERMARKIALEEEEKERREKGPDPNVIAAVKAAQASTLYQHLSEKHRSQAAKEHMGVDIGGDGLFGNIAEAFENAENLLEHKDVARAGQPVVLGGSLWDWVAGRAGPGPCGR